MNGGYVPPVTPGFPTNFPIRYGWPTGNGNDAPVWFDFPKYAATRCIFRKEPFLNGANGGVDAVPDNGGVNIPFVDQDDMLKKIVDNHCCEIIAAGHQGGEDNNGGVKGIFDCNDKVFAKKLRQAIKDAGCSNCTIILAACAVLS